MRSFFIGVAPSDNYAPESPNLAIDHEGIARVVYEENVGYTVRYLTIDPAALPAN
jgi:hypothetical protein